VTHSADESWQINLTNKISEVILPQTKLVKLVNTSDIIITSDSKLLLTGQTKLEGLRYTDKKLNKLTFEHELNSKLATMETVGKHNLQLESGASMQIMHTEKNVKLLMAEQPVMPLQKLINQFNNKVQLLSGTFSTEISGTLSSSQLFGHSEADRYQLKI